MPDSISSSDLFDLKRVKVFPLAERRSQCSVEAVMVAPGAAPPECPPDLAAAIRACARGIRSARERGATVMMIYGAHLVKNGGNLLVRALVQAGWINHLATNGAGTIHDWEFAAHGRSTESVRDNVATGTFGTWQETGRTLHLSLLAGGLRGEGYGRSLGRCMVEEGLELPDRTTLETALREQPAHPLAPARAEMLRCLIDHDLRAGRLEIPHPWKNTSILAGAFEHAVPLTVHPGIGYDIITNHPMFNGAAIGRAAALDFRRFCSSVDRLDGGVVLSVGSAIMGPQVFEKSLSCVNNVRLQSGRAIVQDHSIHVVDLQDGGGWDWTHGEPPRDNPAYYLRFCKSYSRMGGAMHYLCCDNLVFLQRLHQELMTS